MFQTIYHLSLVSMTPVINIYFRISPRIFVKILKALFGYSGARRKLIHEKNRGRKSRVRLPLRDYVGAQEYDYAMRI
jgi:hypothetical protein